MQNLQLLLLQLKKPNKYLKPIIFDKCLQTLVMELMESDVDWNISQEFSRYLHTLLFNNMFGEKDTNLEQAVV